MRCGPCAIVRLSPSMSVFAGKLIGRSSTGCKKGSRECTYPEPRATPKTVSGSKRDQSRTAADDSQSLSDGEESEEQVPPAGRRRKQSATQNPGSSSKSSQQGTPSNPVESPQASIEHVKLEGSLSPSTDASSVPTSAGWERPEKFSSASRETSQEDQLWSHLSPDLQFYLAYHRTELTYHHWFFKHDANHFLHHILIDQALSYDPLLYAVAGFAAYQWTVKQPNGKMQDFLRHYDKSVSLLLRSLQDNQKHTDATMLTILQLATFEVGHPLKDSTRADKR